MAKYKCPFCEEGFAHTSGQIPNPNEYLFISDSDFENENDKINHSDLYRKMNHMFVCLFCKSIAIFWEGFDNNPTWYNKQEL